MTVLVREDARDWLVLERTPRVGPIAMARLMEAFGTPGAALRASAEAISLRAGLSPKLAAIIAGFTPPEEDVQRDLRTLADVGARIITRWDEEYPANLKSIYDPPALLFVRGEMLPADEKAVAMVGTRHPDRYGIEVAERIAGDLARAGVVIVSGLARGIDAACHHAALAAGGRTIGVLGCGLDVAYPPQNKKLIEEMVVRGAVISEFRPGAPPLPTNFFRRNRIVSGLSKGVLVVEAGLKSGTLITVNHALDQNRDVAATPGNIFNMRSRGPHHLIRQGALLVESAQDILDAMFAAPKIDPATAFRSPVQAKFSDLVDEDLSEEHHRVLDAIDLDPVAIDALCESLTTEPGRLAGILLELELGGFIRQHPGKLFSRICS